TGMDRRATAVRSVERLVGTALGILLFLLGGFADSGPWAFVATIVVLQGLVELLIVCNYTAAVVFMTSLALTIGTAGSARAGVEIAQEGLVDKANGESCGVVEQEVDGLRVSQKRIWQGVEGMLRS